GPGPRRAMSRGPGSGEPPMQALFRRYATTLDSTLVTQAVTGLQALAVLVTFTSASPTAALLYPKILGAAAGVEAALLAQATPSHAIMHSRRWYWLPAPPRPHRPPRHPPRPAPPPGRGRPP